ncbi:DUF2461 domain-containing protein [Tenacibaculum maritimum]|uniref:DUF2461 domain-containing protein n=1 Tax=Tenacibaculum maritimum TaxID=107401 RepID=UPI0012E68991|nr:DUF2461 domain-containing protein [Tenacibaculum maritimum]CAA0176715.1 conserved hypothetical protein [Tenacibaculum maritimum]
MIQIEKSTFSFLNELKSNNNRDWFSDNKLRFIKEQKRVKDFYNEVRGALEKHDEIDDFKLFRIYRDIRFSKDKTPYQPHFAGAFSRRTKKLRGSYYLRIRPEGSFLAGGFWKPNKEDLLRIRKEIEMDPVEIQNILENKNFTKCFGGVLHGEELKTAPKGFDRNHKAIHLIRKKGFIAIRNFTDKEVLSKQFLVEIDRSYKALRPFLDYMSDVLTTNENGECLI